MALLSSYHELSTIGKIGDWVFMDDARNNDGDAYICFIYPVKSSYPGEPDRGDIAVIPIKGNPLPNNQVWQWDGNREAPTITPSVRVIGSDNQPDIWHGYLTAGKIVTV